MGKRNKIAMRRFDFFDQNGDFMSTKHSIKEFPEEWLPTKGSPKRKGKGGKPTSSNVYVFTTSTMTAKNSKFMDLKDWDAVKIGDEFWLPSGCRMSVLHKEKIDKGKWNAIFQDEKSYKKAAKVFLNMSDEDQTEFSKLPATDQIAFLNVPLKAQKNFRDERWAIEPLTKYCQKMANIDAIRKEIKRQEEEVYWKKTFSIMKREAKIARALEYDDVRPEAIVDYETSLKYEVKSQCSSNQYYSGVITN